MGHLFDSLPIVSKGILGDPDLFFVPVMLVRIVGSLLGNFVELKETGAFGYSSQGNQCSSTTTILRVSFLVSYFPTLWLLSTSSKHSTYICSY